MSLSRVVIPGDDIVEVGQVTSEVKVILGPGLKRCENEVVVAVKPGILRSNASNVFWIDVHSKKYEPAKGDNVIGVVINKSNENFRYIIQVLCSNLILKCKLEKRYLGEECFGLIL